MKVHIDQLPLKSNYIILDAKFHEELFDKVLKLSGNIANASRLMQISKSALGRFFRKEITRIRIDFILKIIRLVNISLEETEKSIIWIGSNQSKGIVNPKLPFDFNSRSAARFIAAICNDGWISDGAYYSNNSDDLRNSVRNDALHVFGGNKEVIKDWIKDKDQYLSFPSIIRDVLNVVTRFKGVKSENNPPIPPFILENRELMLGWIEQTIADEGNVRHYPETYRREIVWRRSFSKSLPVFKLNRDELKMLNMLEIGYDIKNIGTYKTKKGIEKIRMQIRIARRKNLLKLRKLIKIPMERKDKTFTEITEGYIRYKEPLRIHDAIVKICQEKGFVTSNMLKKAMGYKDSTCALKWINKYSREGLLKCINKAFHLGVLKKVPARYALAIPKRF